MPLNISESDKILNPMRWAKNFSSPEIALAYVHRMGKEGEFREQLHILTVFWYHLTTVARSKLIAPDQHIYN